MSGSVLLDTTVAIDHLRRRNGQLVQHLQSGGMLHLPLTALGELHAGVERSSQPVQTLAGVRAFLNSVSILYPDDLTATQYGKIYAELAVAGTPIPQNDLWIAALARQHGLPVATQDTHFAYVRGLTVLNW
jgi:tRNA(fMet)-specific endonuclease VapC